jgi:glycerol kinase
MECIGALDNGTQSTRFIVYDAQARAIAQHQVEYEQHTPKPGYAAPPSRHFRDLFRLIVGKSDRLAQRLS